MFSTWIQQAGTFAVPYFPLPRPSPTSYFWESTFLWCWLYKREPWKAQKIHHEPPSPRGVSTLMAAKILCIPSNRSGTMRLYKRCSGRLGRIHMCFEGLKQAPRPAPRGLPFQSSLVYLSTSQAVEMWGTRVRDKMDMFMEFKLILKSVFPTQKSNKKPMLRKIASLLHSYNLNTSVSKLSLATTFFRTLVCTAAQGTDSILQQQGLKLLREAVP